MRMICHRGELDDIRLTTGQTGMDLAEVLGRLREVMQADDALRLAEAGNRAGDVVLQVDIVDALGNCRAEQHQPFCFRYRATSRRPRHGDR